MCIRDSSCSDLIANIKSARLPKSLTGIYIYNNHYYEFYSRKDTEEMIGEPMCKEPFFQQYWLSIAIELKHNELEDYLEEESSNLKVAG